MKWYCKIGIVIFVTILGYLLGNWIPSSYLKPNIEDATLKSSEYYSLVVRIIAAIITFLAVVVALFKEDIRKWWNYSKLEVAFFDENGLSEKLETQKNETDSDAKNYKAEKYESILRVENTGNMTAKNCEIYIEKITFINNTFKTEQNLFIQTPMIKWGTENDTKLHIPPKGKRTVTLVELLSPKKQSSPDGKEISTSPKLFIGGVSNSEQYTDGKWEASFMIYSDDSNPVSFKLSLEWNGKWEQRFSEIKNCFTIKIVK